MCLFRMEIERKLMNLEKILKLTQNIRLIGASKYVDAKTIEHFYKLGIKEFGENRIQALKAKKEELDKENLDIKWHFIGNLQSNKINLLIRQKPHLWQSCNGIEMAKLVNKKLDYTLDTLLEINIAKEDSKQGIEPNKALEEYLQIQEECSHLNLCGIMCMGSHSDDKKQIAKDFEQAYKIYENLKKHKATICSMGMSNDFELAIKCGSNMVRLGSILFKSP